MKNQCDILLIGSGSLANNVALSLSLMSQKKPIRILQVGRKKEVLRQCNLICNMRSYIENDNMGFRHIAIDLNNQQELVNLLNIENPKIVLLCCSLQTPWISNDCHWNKLIQTIGFGLTLPLQADLALRVGYSLKKSQANSLFINACYPDVVNYILQRHNIDIFSGVGNINIISSYLANLWRRRYIKVIAHHFHLSNFGPDTLKDKRFHVVNDGEVCEVSCEAIASLLSIKGRALNHMTGTLIADLLVNILSGSRFSTNLPGPGGLIGGYPVEICDNTIRVSLPDSVSMDTAIQNNKRWTEREGLIISDTEVICFPDSVAQLLKKYGFTFHQGFKLEDIISIADEIQMFRGGKLRRKSYV